MKQRETELDILRFHAMLAVIITHVCSGPSDQLSVYSSQWVTINCIRASITWDVPVFVMISGRFFLDETRALSVKQLFSKYIRRLIVAFLVWSAVYQIYYCLYYHALGLPYLNIKGILTEWLLGPYHLWYLYMLAGLYLITPLLRIIARDKKMTEYFLLLFLVFQFLTQYGIAIPLFGPILQIMLDKTGCCIALGFSGYFLLGYYLRTYGVPKRMEIPLYCIGVILIFFSCIATTLHSQSEGAPNEWFSKYLMPNIIIESAAIYTFFTQRVSKFSFSEKTRTFFGKMTELSFGVYLVHALVNELVALTGFTAAVRPLLTAPVITAIVLIISIILTMLIRKIPRLGTLIT